LFGLTELLDVPLIGPILHGVRAERPELDERLTRLEAVRRMIGAMIDDVMGETLRRAGAPASPRRTTSGDWTMPWWPSRRTCTRIWPGCAPS